jgi:hypothetical protein
MPFSRAYREAPILPSMPRRRTRRDHHAVDAGEGQRGAGRRVAVVAGTQRMSTRAVVREPGRAHRLADRQVRVGQVDVLADEARR